MAKACSSELRERVIEAVQMGASRREAAELYDVSASSAIKWVQRRRETGRATAKPHGGSVSPLDKFGTQILVVIAEQPDGTLVETAAVPRRRRVRTSYSSPWRFLDRHDITLKKRCKALNGRAPKSPARGDVGFESKAWIPPAGIYRRDRSLNMVRLRGGSARRQTDRRHYRISLIRAI
jgi:transposase